MSDRIVKAALFDGAVPGRTVQVSDDGKLEVSATGSTVSSNPGPATTSTTKTVVGTTSTDIANANSNRIQITFQNTDATNGIFLRFADDTSNAGTDDLKIAPGGIHSFPPGVTYTGKIKAKGEAANTKYVLIQYSKP